MLTRLATVENDELGKYDVDLESEVDGSEMKPTNEDQAVLSCFHTTMVVEIPTSTTRSGYIDLMYALKNEKLASGLNVSVLIAFA